MNFISMFKEGDVVRINWDSKNDRSKYWMKYGDIDKMKVDGISYVRIISILPNTHMLGCYRIESLYADGSHRDIHCLDDSMLFPKSNAISLFINI